MFLSEINNQSINQSDGTVSPHWTLLVCSLAGLRVLTLDINRTHLYIHESTKRNTSVVIFAVVSLRLLMSSSKIAFLDTFVLFVV